MILNLTNGGMIDITYEKFKATLRWSVDGVVWDSIDLALEELYSFSNILVHSMYMLEQYFPYSESVLLGFKQMKRYTSTAQLINGYGDNNQYLLLTFNETNLIDPYDYKETTFKLVADDLYEFDVDLLNSDLSDYIDCCNNSIENE